PTLPSPPYTTLFRSGRMLEHRDLAQADPGRGKFRSFLLGALKHFMANERDRARAKKRGGDVVHVEISLTTADEALTPDQLFDKRSEEHTSELQSQDH